MTQPHTKTEIIAELTTLQTQITTTISGLTAEQFTRQPAEEWSVADYFKHLLLSVKPFAKGLTIPKAELLERFDAPDHPSKIYAEMKETYTNFLGQGFRAEDSPLVVPVSFRFPEGITDEQSYLLQNWADTHQKLFTALESWSEEELDQYNLPHLAFGAITIREMLFFMIYHNSIHAGDIARLSA